jgi:hypothetical protein
MPAAALASHWHFPKVTKKIISAAEVSFIQRTILKIFKRGHAAAYCLLTKN